MYIFKYTQFQGSKILIFEISYSQYPFFFISNVLELNFASPCRIDICARFVCLLSRYVYRLHTRDRRLLSAVFDYNLSVLSLVFFCRFPLCLFCVVPSQISFPNNRFIFLLFVLRVSFASFIPHIYLSFNPLKVLNIIIELC